MKRCLRVLLALVLMAVAADGREAIAQSFERSRVDGVVTDESGGLLPGVTVVVRNSDTGLVREVITDADGRYVVPGLPPGSYEVRAELTGFQPALQPKVTLQVGQTTSIDLALKVGTVSEQVTVVGEAPLIETSKSDFSSVVNSEQIDNLPINGRNFLDFATLTPGVVLNQSTAINGIGANVAGARSRNGSVLVDGFNNLDDGFTSPRLIYSQEAIQEFQVLTLGFGAEFGRATGGIVNAVTKSGSNNFEGRLFTYFRDKSLNARNAFEQGEKAGFRRWQVGGTVGGPIKQDRLFYFGSIERQDFSAPTVVTIAPSTAAILGLPANELGAQQKRDDYNAFFGKVTHNASPNDFLEYTFAHSNFIRANLTNVGGLATPSGGTGTRAHDYLLAGKWTRVFGGGRIVNELRASYNPRHFWVDPQGEGPRVAISGVATWGRATNSPNEQTTQQGQIINHLTMTAGRHDVKVGIDFYPVDYEIYFPGGEFGSYSFASLATFQAGNYISYSQTFGENRFVLPHAFYAGFVQDSWRVRSNFTVNAGVRYEYEAQPTWNDREYPSDSNNFGPRGGFAWDLRGDGKAVLRAETGRFYDKNFGNIPLNTFRGISGVSRAYSFLGPTAAGAPRYPAVLTTEPGAAALGSSNVRIMVEDPSIPQAWQSSVGVDLAIGSNTAATISVLRNDQSRQYVNITRNRVQIINGVSRRPDPTLGTISVYEPSGVSLYNAMSIELRRRFADGLQMHASYTLGDAKADSNDFGSSYIDENHREWDYGPAPDDVRHNFVVNGTYQVPRTALNVGAIFRFNTGRPYSASAGADLNADGVNNDRAPGFEDDPNSFRMDSLYRTDIRLAYRLGLTGDRRLEVIGELFNVFNQTYFTSVNNTWGTTATPRPTFGQPLTAADPRVAQIGFRFLF